MLPGLMIIISIEFCLVTIFIELVSDGNRFLKYFLAPVTLIAMGWSMFQAFQGHLVTAGVVEPSRLVFFNLGCFFSVVLTGLFLDYVLPMLKRRM